MGIAASAFRQDAASAVDSQVLGAQQNAVPAEPILWRSGVCVTLTVAASPTRAAPPGGAQFARAAL